MCRPRFEALEDRCCLSAIDVAISTPNFTFNESDQNTAEIVVTRNGGLADPFFGGGHSVKVQYLVGREAGDTATLGKDYKADKGTLTFGKFETTKTIRVSVVPDRLDEDNERFSIRLTKIAVSKGGTGSFGNDLIRVFIDDDDEPPNVTIVGPPAVKEANKTINYKVKLTQASGKFVKYDYGVISRSPTLKFFEGDFLEADDAFVPDGRIGVLTFPPGKTQQTITVKVSEDKIFEPNEAFAIGVFAKENALGSFEMETTILDDDKAIVGIRGLESATKHTEFEGQSGDTIITLKIRLFSDIETDVFPAYETFDDTATVADGDYLPAFQGVLFLAGSKGAQSEVSFLINITIKGDTKKEKSEKFDVDLLADAEGLKIVGGRITVTILDDD